MMMMMMSKFGSTSLPFTGHKNNVIHHKEHEGEQLIPAGHFTGIQLCIACAECATAAAASLIVVVVVVIALSSRV